MTTSKRQVTAALMGAVLLAACTSGRPSERISTVTIEPAVSRMASSSSSNPCDNPWFPVAEGNTWTYSVSSPALGELTSTDTVSHINPDSFTVTTTSEPPPQGFPKAGTSQEWRCGQEGLIQLPGQLPAGTGVKTTTKTKEASGVALPRQISAGDTWEQHTVAESVETFAAGQTRTRTTDLTLSFKAIGVEDLRTPAGSFQAMRIDVAVNTRTSMSDQGESHTTSSEVTWYAPGVGLVRQELPDSGVTLTLIDFSLS